MTDSGQTPGNLIQSKRIAFHAQGRSAPYNIHVGSYSTVQFYILVYLGMSDCVFWVEIRLSREARLHAKMDGDFAARN